MPVVREMSNGKHPADLVYDSGIRPLGVEFFEAPKSSNDFPSKSWNLWKKVSSASCQTNQEKGQSCTRSAPNG